MEKRARQKEHKNIRQLFEDRMRKRRGINE